MTTISSTDTAVQTPFDDAEFDEAQLAAASFLARYSGRTLEAALFTLSSPHPRDPRERTLMAGG